MTRLPPELARQLAAIEPTIRAAFLQSIADIRSEAQMALVVDAIERGDMARLIAVLHLDQTFFAPLDSAIQGAYYEGGVRALAGLPVIPDPVGPGKSLSASTGAIPGRSGGFGRKVPR